LSITPLSWSDLRAISVVKILEWILVIPAVALAIGIAIVGVIHVYRYVKYELSKE